MSYIGNSPGVSSQRVVTEEVISGSAKSAFYPVGGYALGYVDVLINGLEVDSSDFTATDGVVVTLATAAQIGDTVKIKAYIPRGLSDGYLKSEADARFPRVDTASQGLNSTQKTNVLTNIGGQAALGYTPVNKAGDTMTGNLVVPLSIEMFTDGVSGTQRHGRISGTASANNAYAGGVKLEYYNFNGTAYQFYDGLVVDGIGNTTLAGNLVLASGKGIDFSATANGSGSMTGELLNDYEEGTWTPTLGGNATYAIQEGIYTKIGRQVTVRFDLQVSALGTGNIRTLSGLPYTVAGANYYTAAAGYWMNINAVNVMSIILVGTNGMYFETTTASTTSSPNDNVAIWGNGVRILMTATYFTN